MVVREGGCGGEDVRAVSGGCCQGRVRGMGMAPDCVAHPARTALSENLRNRAEEFGASPFGRPPPMKAIQRVVVRARGAGSPAGQGRRFFCLDHLRAGGPPG